MAKSRMVELKELCVKYRDALEDEQAETDAGKPRKFLKLEGKKLTNSEWKSQVLMMLLHFERELTDEEIAGGMTDFIEESEE